MILFGFAWWRRVVSTALLFANYPDLVLLQHGSRYLGNAAPFGWLTIEAIAFKCWLSRCSPSLLLKRLSKSAKDGISSMSCTSTTDKFVFRS